MNKVFLGIELGSTRIKAVAIDELGAALASGSFSWENRQADGFRKFMSRMGMKG